MAKGVRLITESWRTFTSTEKRNVVIYILGIMLYKLGLEAFNGSITALATNRYDYDAFKSSRAARTFERVGLLTGLNQAFQCVGSILIAPLVKRYPTKNVLACSMLVFGLFAAMLLVLDAATGGTFVPARFRQEHPKDDFSYYGHYNTDGIIPIYCITGISYGMIELIRRILPNAIVGGNIQKLRRIDALVHICYETAGTAGALLTGLVLIPYFGNNFSFIITPVCFTAASIVWYFISDLGFQIEKPEVLERQPSYVKAVFGGFVLFGESVWTGAKIIFGHRKFFCLPFGYSLGLYAHKFLESGVAPAIAKRYLGESAWSQIMVGGSNAGELLGALFVFLFTNLVTTPMPWLRLDSALMLIIWYLPFWHPPPGQVKYAWIIAATFMPLSFGWAAGDVSLTAYIQASLARVEPETKNVSALGAVMAFLYSTYITLYAVTSPILGRYIDSVYKQTGGADGGDVHSAILNVGGLQFTLISALMMASTFIPSGAFALNPKMLSDETVDHGLDAEANVGTSLNSDESFKSDFVSLTILQKAVDSKC